MLRPILVAILLTGGALSGMSAAWAAGLDEGPEPGDLVRVTVYGQEDLTTLARVSSNNQISFPFIGQIQVGGIPTAQAQANIARALEREGIVRNPQVSVLVETEGAATGEFVTILGHVNAPGRYALGDQSEVGTETLLDLLAAAGGTTAEANSQILLFRADTGESDGRQEIDVDRLMEGGALHEVNMTLANGDVVVVPEVDVFYIYGQVSRPGRYSLEKNMMVMHAISVGGGVTDRGNESGIVLTRQAEGKEKQINAALNEQVLPGDVIYVKERFF